MAANKFLENWSPDRSRRETRKLTRKTYRETPHSFHFDEKGTRLKTGRNDCDCLELSCPGCHFPCPKCSSPKCGHECRVNRRWIYEGVEVEGKEDDTIRNKYK